MKSQFGTYWFWLLRIFFLGSVMDWPNIGDVQGSWDVPADPSSDPAEPQHALHHAPADRAEQPPASPDYLPGWNQQTTKIGWYGIINCTFREELTVESLRVEFQLSLAFMFFCSVLWNPSLIYNLEYTYSWVRLDHRSIICKEKDSKNQ